MQNDFKRGFWYSIGCIMGAAVLNVAAKRLCDKLDAITEKIDKKKEDFVEESD